MADETEKRFQWTLKMQDVVAAREFCGERAYVNFGDPKYSEGLLVHRALFGPEGAVTPNGSSVDFWITKRSALHTCSLDHVVDLAPDFCILLVRGRAWDTILRPNELYAFMLWVAKYWEQDLRVDTAAVAALVFYATSFAARTGSGNLCSIREFLEVLKKIEAQDFSASAAGAPAAEGEVHPYVAKRFLQLGVDLHAKVMGLPPSSRVRIVTRVPPSELIEAAFRCCLEMRGEREDPEVLI